jgi:hypothetical protein
VNTDQYKIQQSDSEETADSSLKRSIERVNDQYSMVLKMLAEHERQEKEGAD